MDLQSYTIGKAISPFLSDRVINHIYNSMYLVTTHKIFLWILFAFVSLKLAEILPYCCSYKGILYRRNCTIILRFGIMELWNFLYKKLSQLDSLFILLSPQNQLDIYFLTLWEYWLGLAKPKNVFGSILNPSIK